MWYQASWSCILHISCAASYLYKTEVLREKPHTVITRHTQTALGIKVGPQNKQPATTHLSKIMTILSIVYRYDKTQKAPAN